jgi:hypothetical protein
MRRSNLASAAALSVAAGIVRAAKSPSPIVLPQGDWLGNDGNWSTTRFKVGENQQDVNTLVSTSLAEFWTIGQGGCVSSNPQCTIARGGTFNPSTSQTWNSLGVYGLPLPYLGDTGPSDYGLDKICTYDPVMDVIFDMTGVIISPLNTSDYFLGMFGLGLTQSSFGNFVADCPLSQAVKDFGWIPSYSYGYTAGAHYHNTPISATLGGYDASRFKPHDTDFTLTTADGVPRALVRSIEVTTGQGAETPRQWDSDTEALATWNSSFIAMIDSSTPFLWLPEDVCNRFADAFNLTYDDNFDLYTVTDDTYQQLIKEDAFSFTFTLSSFDNTDDLGDALGAPGVVNLTISSRALASTLKYPFGNIAYGDPAVPYFSLRKSNDSTFIIGRAFLQETYLITKYDEARFSIHQAVFSDEHNIVAIAQPNNSPYPPPSDGQDSHELSTPQMVGIGVGVTVAAAIIGAFLAWFFWRRRRIERENAVAAISQHKASTSSFATSAPPTPLSKIFTRMALRKHSVRETPEALEKSVSNGQPAEAPDSAIYELPAPPAPVELAVGDDDSIAGDTDFGNGAPSETNAYERAKRKVEYQLRGPVPQYSPPSQGFMPPPEKEPFQLDLSEIPRRAELPSPVSSTARSDRQSNSYRSLPSPLSPKADASQTWDDCQSGSSGSGFRRSLNAITKSYSTASRIERSTGRQSEHHRAAIGRSNSEKSVSPMSATSLQLPLHGTTQRAPIDPSKVICLGTLHEDSLPSDMSSLPQLPLPDFGSSAGPYSGLVPEAVQSVESLGSNFTEEEERMVAEMTRQPNLPPTLPGTQNTATFGGPWDPPSESHSQTTGPWPTFDPSSPGFPPNRERIDPGVDLVHVPQIPNRRYSWEE